MSEYFRLNMVLMTCSLHGYFILDTEFFFFFFFFSGFRYTK